MRQILIFLVGMTLASDAVAATAHVHDTLFSATGIKPTGTITVTWNRFQNAQGQLIPAGSTATAIRNGVVDLNLEPNQGATPTGTYYTVHYAIQSPYQDDEDLAWIIPTSTLPLTIAQVEGSATSQNPSSSIIALSQLAAGGAINGYCLVFMGGAWAPAACSGVAIGASGVTAGTYGTTSAIPQFTVATDGRITSATTVSVAIPSLPAATSSLLGGIKCGTGLTCAGDGTATVTGGATGPQGPAGPAGATGAQGPAGAGTILTAPNTGGPAPVSFSPGNGTSTNDTLTYTTASQLTTILTGQYDAAGAAATAQAAAIAASDPAPQLCTVTFSATPVFNLTGCSAVQITLTGNVTSSTVSNAVTGKAVAFLIYQDSTGGHTFAWPTGTQGAMTIGSIASKHSTQIMSYTGSVLQANAAPVVNQ